LTDTTHRTVWRAGEIARAIVDIEALGPKVAWSVGTITNDCHAVRPYGEGIHVTIAGPGTEAHPDSVRVFEKHHGSFAEATKAAIARYKRRAAGERGA
jgi:hypothetical protein